MQTSAVDGYVDIIARAAKHLAPRGESEDVAQEALFKLWQWIERNPSAEPAHREAMAHTYVRTASIDAGRKRDAKCRKASAKLPHGLIDAIGPTVAPDVDAASREVMAIVRENVEALPASLADVMMSYLFGGETQPQRFRGKLHRGKVRLRESLANAGVA